MRGWAWEVITDPVTAIAAAVLLIVAVAAARPLARWRGWPVGPTFGLLVAVAAVAVLTLLPAPGHPVGGPSGTLLGGCLQALADPEQLWTRGLLATSSRGERLGNIAMLLPVTLFAVLAVRRVVPVAVCGVLAPVAVELAQALLGAGRTCTGYDWVNNATGALLGALLGAALLRRARRRDRSAA